MLLSSFSRSATVEAAHIRLNALPNARRTRSSSWSVVGPGAPAGWVGVAIYGDSYAYVRLAAPVLLRW
jgi:hypothetical protein